MKSKLFPMAMALFLTPLSFAGETLVSEQLDNFSTNVEDHEYMNCSERVFRSSTRTRKQGALELRNKRERFTVRTKSAEHFVVKNSVNLNTTMNIGAGDGCIDLRLLKSSNGKGYSGIAYYAHARSDGVGTHGAVECELRWRECTID